MKMKILISLSAKGTENITSELAILKKNDRKLTPGELKMFAVMLATGNLGLEKKPLEFKDGNVTVYTPSSHSTFPVDSDDSCYKAGTHLYYGLLNYVGDEDYADGEFKSWFKDLKKMTLHSIAKAWPDYRPVCLYLATK